MSTHSNEYTPASIIEPVSPTSNDSEITSPNNSSNINKELKYTPPYTPHNGENRQYMRDIILGFNDGLVSMFLLIFGLSGGGATSYAILLAGIAGTVAGSISMGLGEYLATKSQVQVQESDIALEQIHFKHHRDIELEEMRGILGNLGLEGSLLEEAVQTIAEKDETLLNFMLTFEFGVTEIDERSPLVAMLISGVLFTTGALPSVLPFACTTDVTLATIVAGFLCALACFALGAIKTIATHGITVFHFIYYLR